VKYAICCIYIYDNWRQENNNVRNRLHERVYGGIFDEYIERLEQYFVATVIGALPAGVADDGETRQAAEKRWVATFLTLVGGRTYKLLKSLVNPNLPSTRPKPFEEVTETLKKPPQTEDIGDCRTNPFSQP